MSRTKLTMNTMDTYHSAAWDNATTIEPSTDLNRFVNPPLTPVKHRHHYDKIRERGDHGYFSGSSAEQEIFPHRCDQYFSQGTSGISCSNLQEDRLILHDERERSHTHCLRTLQNCCNRGECTPMKTRSPNSRKCCSDIKDTRIRYRPYMEYTARPPYLKSRKRLDFTECTGPQYHQLVEGFYPHTYSHCDDSVDRDCHRLSVSCAKRDGRRSPPCCTPVRVSCCDDPAIHRTPDMNIAKRNNSQAPVHRYQPVPSCKCSDLKENLIQLAASAFRNLRRKDSTRESFEQFKSELNRTNEYIKQTVLMLETLQNMCVHTP